MRGIVGAKPFFWAAAVFMVLTAERSQASPPATRTVSALAKASYTKEGHAKYFFHDVSDALEFFLRSPSKIAVYSSTTGRFQEDAGRANLVSSGLCSPLRGVDEKIIRSYNAAPARSAARKNFWIVTAACLAAHEGAEAWLRGNAGAMNKLDLPSVTHRKFLYGAFQLSAEKNASVVGSCQKTWKEFRLLGSPSGLPASYVAAHADLVDFSDAKSDGRSETAGAMRSLGQLHRQRFNVFAGVHELLRASVAGKSCLDPFDRSQNRFGPLRSASPALVACLNDHAPKALEAGARLEGLVQTLLSSPSDRSTDDAAEEHRAR